MNAGKYKVMLVAVMGIINYGKGPCGKRVQANTVIIIIYNNNIH